MCRDYRIKLQTHRVYHYSRKAIAADRFGRAVMRAERLKPGLCRLFVLFGPVWQKFHIYMNWEELVGELQITGRCKM